MKIVITATFKVLYQKFRGKQKPSLFVFAEKIGQDIKKEHRHLHRPYLKIKCTMHQKTMTILAEYQDDICVLLPIFITDKNDTLYGENMRWETIQPLVTPLMQKIADDLRNERIEIFDIE